MLVKMTQQCKAEDTIFATAFKLLNLALLDVSSQPLSTVACVGLGLVVVLPLPATVSACPK